MIDYEEEISKINPLTLKGIEEYCRAKFSKGNSSYPSRIAYPNKDFSIIFTERTK